MEAQMRHLHLDTNPGVLNLEDDVLGSVLRAAHRIGALEPLASTCRQLNELARSRIPVPQLRLQDAASARLLLRLVAAGRPMFCACDSLVAVAEDVAACYQLPGVLKVAAGLSNLRTLDLTVSPPPLPAAAAAGGEEEGAEEGAEEEEDDEEEAAAAAATLAMLEEYDSIVSGLISPLYHLKQLQQLKLAVPVLGTCGAAELASIKQLTSLQLTLSDATDPMHADLSHLSGMRCLVELSVNLDGGPMAPAAADGPFALPSSLRRLQLGGDTAYWLQHLPGCPHLEQLDMDYDWCSQHASAHPAAVLRLAARHTPALRRLTCGEGNLFDLQLPFLPSPPVDQHQQLSSQGVSALTTLQHLELRSQLSVGSADEWEALCGLPALTCLQGIVVQEPPPRSLEHPRVQQLSLQLERVDGAGAAQVLLAFPVVRQAHLCIQGIPNMYLWQCGPGRRRQSQPQILRQDLPPALSSLTSLRLEYTNSPPGVSQLVHAPPILAAARGAARLDFGRCAHPRDGYLSLPDVSLCSAVTYLSFGGSYGAGADQVVEMVQLLAPTLRGLKLECMERVSPWAAIMLQDVLPHLEHITFHYCCKFCHHYPSAGSEEEQLARLQQQLRPGLTLSVSP